MALRFKDPDQVLIYSMTQGVLNNKQSLRIKLQVTPKTKIRYCSKIQGAQNRLNSTQRDTGYMLRSKIQNREKIKQ